MTMGFLKKKPSTLPTGRLGERFAAEFLRRLRYRVVATNYRQPFGEIDIIAQDGTVWVFVEVKTRKSTAFGTAVEAVDGHKQRQLSRVALEYLQRHGLHEAPARFDVLAVHLALDNALLGVDHLKNAFDFIV